MADGKGSRWNEYLGIPKHFVKIRGEEVILRTVRLLREMTDGEAEIIVTSHDPRYEFEGCRRHEPLNNVYEIDRFTAELIEDDMCFLYGDTYYTKESLAKIIGEETDDLLFFGNEKSIVAIRVKDADVFRAHVDRAREAFLRGETGTCKGWQVYRSFTGQPLEEKSSLEEKFVIVDENTKDINTPKDYEEI